MEQHHQRERFRTRMPHYLARGIGLRRGLHPELSTLLGAGDLASVLRVSSLRSMADRQRALARTAALRRQTHGHSPALKVKYDALLRETMRRVWTTKPGPPQQRSVIALPLPSQSRYI